MADSVLQPATGKPGIEIPSDTQAQTLPVVGTSGLSPVLVVAGVLVVLLAIGSSVALKRPATSGEPLPEPPKPGSLPEAGEAPALTSEGPAVDPAEKAAVAEALQRAEAEERHRKAHAEELTRRLSAATGADRAPLERELEEANRLAREAEEERKKAGYRAKKLTDLEERERKRVEAAERAAAEARAAEAARIAAEEAKAAALAAEKAKAEAFAGKTLAEGLGKTRSGFMGRLGQLFGTQVVVDEKMLAELEDVLFTADIGVETAQRLFETARTKVKARELADGSKLKAALRAEISRILSLDGVGKPFTFERKPTVVMVVGVNGAGKTTTLGKLSSQLQQSGKKVLLGAGDTFRAAASEQLDVWAQRAGVPIVRGAEGGDPGAVCFDAVKKGVAEGFDVVLLDTAGRLHTKVGLMDELKKVRRVVDKALPGAPHEVLLVLDSTNGQNAIEQARQFNEALGVTGIALTKLDGTAKGGVVIGICDELKLPVRYVGVGEGIADLRAFSAAEFADVLFD